jgi:hypothetical protein
MGTGWWKEKGFEHLPPFDFSISFHDVHAALTFL